MLKSNGLILWSLKTIYDRKCIIFCFKVRWFVNISQKYYRRYNMRSWSDDARDRRRPLPVRAFPLRAHRARPAQRTQRLPCSHPYLITLTFFATDTNEANKHISKLCNYATLRVFMWSTADLSSAEFMMLPLVIDKSDHSEQHPLAHFWKDDCIFLLFDQIYHLHLVINLQVLTCHRAPS